MALQRKIIPEAFQNSRLRYGFLTDGVEFAVEALQKQVVQPDFRFQRPFSAKIAQQPVQHSTFVLPV